MMRKPVYCEELKRQHLEEVREEERAKSYGEDVDG
jgi:hypothetical protein